MAPDRTGCDGTAIPEAMLDLLATSNLAAISSKWPDPRDLARSRRLIAVVILANCCRLWVQNPTLAR